jgi:hypothetical protein
MSVETTLHYSWHYAQVLFHTMHSKYEQSTSKHQGNVMFLESALKDLVIIFSFTYEMFSLKFMNMI